MESAPFTIAMILLDKDLRTLQSNYYSNHTYSQETPPDSNNGRRMITSLSVDGMLDTELGQETLSLIPHHLIVCTHLHTVIWVTIWLCSLLWLGWREWQGQLCFEESMFWLRHLGSCLERSRQGIRWEIVSISHHWIWTSPGIVCICLDLNPFDYNI